MKKLEKGLKNLKITFNEEEIEKIIKKIKNNQLNILYLLILFCFKFSYTFYD